MHLYLIRHGQSEENKAGWDGRNTNSSLTELGLAQAQAAGRWLKNTNLNVLYASPMQRASQTAQCIAGEQGLDIIFDDLLREVGNSYPDGKPFPDDNLPTYFLNVWGSLHPYKSITEGGETWMHFRARIGGWLEWLIENLPEQHTDYAVGVVCHGGVIEGFFEHIFEKGPRSAVMVWSNNTGITRLEYSPLEGFPSWRVIYHNNTRHLEEDMLT